MRMFAPGGGEAAKKDEAKPPEKPKENPLHLPPDKRAAAGITVGKAEETTLAPQVPGFGRVLDPAPFVALIAEQETARTAVASSEKELQRVQKLFAAGGNASAQAVETAESAVARDRATLASARARLLAGWGRELAAAPNLQHVTDELEKGTSLLRIDVLAGETPAEQVKTARVALPGTKEFLEAQVLGAAPAADPQIQGVGYLAVLHDRAWPAGTALRAILPGAGEPQKVFKLPRSAVVYHQGSAWIYVLGEEDTFERKIVTTGPGISDGVTIISGADAEEQIVMTGAQQLLSAELQAGGAPDEG